MALQNRIEDGEVDRFYEISRLPLGQRVIDPASGLTGMLVRRASRNWVDRNLKPPMVRWDGKLDAVPVSWQEIRAA